MKVLFLWLVCLVLVTAEPPIPAFGSNTLLPLVTVNYPESFPPAAPPLPDSFLFQLGQPGNNRQQQSQALRNSPDANGIPLQSSTQQQQRTFPPQNLGNGPFQQQQQPQFDGLNNPSPTGNQPSSLQSQFSGNSRNEFEQQQLQPAFERLQQQLSNNGGIPIQSDAFSPGQSSFFQQQQPQVNTNFPGQSFGFSSQQQSFEPSQQNGFSQQQQQQQPQGNNGFVPNNNPGNQNQIDSSTNFPSSFVSFQQGGPFPQQNGDIFQDQQQPQQQNQPNGQNSSGFQQQTESPGNFNNGGFSSGFQQQNGFQSQNQQQQPQNNFQQQSNGQSNLNQNRNANFQSSSLGTGNNGGFVGANDSPQQQSQGPQSTTQSSANQLGRGDFSRNEIPDAPDDNVVKGQYRVGLPDGRTQIVRYIALVTYNNDGPSSQQQQRQSAGFQRSNNGQSGSVSSSTNNNSPFAASSTKSRVIKIPGELSKGRVLDKNEGSPLTVRTISSMRVRKRRTKADLF